MGDGPLRDELLEEMYNTNTSPNIHLLGTVSTPSKLLVAGDIFLLPSVMEGIPLAVAEAMEASLPIVTSHVGALPELLRADEMGRASAGFLIRVNGSLETQIAGYTEALKRLVLEPGLRVQAGRAASQLVRATFDQRVTLTNIFDEMKKAHKARPASAGADSAAAFGVAHMVTVDGGISGLSELANFQHQYARVRRNVTGAARD